MRTIVLATTNMGKVNEALEIMSSSGYQVISLKDVGVSADVDENGSTFEENAMIKAEAFAKLVTQVPAYRDAIVFADDSGLVIDCLNGEPGIYSARYLGEDTPYEYKNKEILRRLEGVPDEERSARFVCAIAAALPDGRMLCETGTMEGRIAYAIEGSNGFGYDPIFFLPEYGMTSAQISPEEKNEISHRGRALRLMKERLDEDFNCK
ncbi:MAG: XTP/dITP diphosphatase [Lachnospiraceae bacterium]|nr:XTP/dITP diphosphatase [Lachnospiraceae bacterium]